MKKSSACGNNNTCVYVGLRPGDTGVVVGNGPVPSGLLSGLRFTSEEWDAFVTGVKAGEFDLVTLRRERDDALTQEAEEATLSEADHMWRTR